MDDRHLFIISRDQPDLLAYLRREFSAEANVEVILDRRLRQERRSLDDRRASPRPAGVAVRDRRGAERRTRVFVDAQLRSIGYAMLHLP